MSGSPKPLYSPTNDPDHRPPAARFISPAASSFPPTQMLEKHFAVSPTESEHPRFNPLNKDRPRSSSLLNINDTVAMHLLVETAIIDSTEYEVLSFEEVEELKKEYKFLAGRIDAAKRKLALESKVRDAALSLSRLYNGKKGKRRSLLGGNEMTQKTDEELVQSNQKIEQLVQELWGLNNRAVEIQRRLLQHTSGILGMTHQGGIKSQGYKGKAPNQRASMQVQQMNGDEFDDRSFYRTSDNLDGIVSNGVYTNRRNQTNQASMYVETNGHGHGTIQQAPQPAPQLNPELEHRLEYLNIELRRYVMASTGVQDIPEVPRPTGDISGLEEQITMLEEGIRFFQQQPPMVAPGNPASEELEQSITTLWDMLVLGNEDSRSRRATLMNGKGYAEDQESEDEDGDTYGTAFSIDAFSYKVQSLYTKATKLRAERASLSKELDQQKQMAAEEREASQQTVQFKEEEHGLEVMKLEQEIDQLNEAIQSRDQDLTTANKELDTLTDEIKNFQEEIRDREDERDQAREDLQAAQDELASLRHELEERSKEISQTQDKDAMTVEQELNARLAAESKLTEKEVAEVALLEKLREREAALKEKEEAEENLLGKLREKEMEFIAMVEAEETLRANLREKEAALAGKAEADAKWERELQEKSDELAHLENKLQEMQGECNVGREELETAKAELSSIVANTEARVKVLEEELERLKEAGATADAEHAVTRERNDKLRLDIQQKDEQLSKMDVEMRELIEKVAQLSTEAVIAKAELDQVYGSKSQRAAETAAAARAAAAREAGQSKSIDPAFLQELDDLAAQNQSLLDEIAALKAANITIQNLEKRNQLLQAELNGMLQDFEGLTKQSIEFENERTKLESVIDRLREKVEALETAVGDERVRMLGSRSMSAGSNGEFPGPRSGGESMSTQVLKTEFKKMMRDMRAEQMKALRAEQEERRKLEAIIRKMKQEQIQQRRSRPISPTTS